MCVHVCVVCVCARMCACCGGGVCVCLTHFIDELQLSSCDAAHRDNLFIAAVSFDAAHRDNHLFATAKL